MGETLEEGMGEGRGEGEDFASDVDVKFDNMSHPEFSLSALPSVSILSGSSETKVYDAAHRSGRNGHNVPTSTPA